MRVEVINTGSELLLGEVVNTHLAFLAGELFPLGLRIERQVCVPDGLAIRTALEEAFPRCDILIVTGGLGPTSDDLTRDVAAELLGLELQENTEVAAAITARFARRKIPLSDRILRQAQVPRGARVLPNANGTAPGLHLPATPETPHLFLLPGPPRELRPMVRDQVLPLLRALLPARAGIVASQFHVTGLGESQVEELIGEQLLAIPGLELGYCARPGQVDIRCLGPGPAVSSATVVVREQLGAHVFSSEDETLESVVVRLLTARARTLAVAESCTGGFLAHRITNVPGASAVFLEGVTTYANQAKTRLLQVPAELIAQHGAVSAEVAQAMAEGALRNAGSDFALATTGISGPSGGTDGKPVGTVFLACAQRDAATTVLRRNFSSDRETFKWLAAQAALDLIRRRLLKA